MQAGSIFSDGTIFAEFVVLSFIFSFKDESLFAVMERIVKAEVHRLVVVDDDNKVVHGNNKIHNTYSLLFDIDFLS